MEQRQTEGRARRLSSEEAREEARDRVSRPCEPVPSLPGLEMKPWAALSDRGATGPPGGGCCCETCSRDDRLSESSLCQGPGRETHCSRRAAQGAEGSSPCDSSCLESLKFFHHDLRSRLLGGDACEAVGVGGWVVGPPPWFAAAAVVGG